MALDTIAVARAEIAQIYIAAFNRVPDAAGLSNWLNQYTAGLMTYAQIAEDFTRQAEYQAKYPSIMTNTEYVTEIYQNVFGRTPDAGGLANWTNQLDHTSITGINRGNIMKLMLDAAGATGNTDGVRLDNQASFAVQSILDGVDTDAATAQLVNITSDTATVTTATAAVSASAIVGQTFSLTTAVNIMTGTSANDTFIADNTGTAEVTSTADSLNGGDGTDTIKIYSDGSIAALPALTSVEKAEIYDEDADLNISATSWASVTEVTMTRGDGEMDLTVGSNVTTVNLADMVLTGDSSGANTAGVEGFKVAFNAAATSATVGLNKITSAAANTDEDVEITGAALTTVNVNATGTASSFDALDVAGANAINIAAAVALTVTSVDTTSTAATVSVSGAGAVNLGTLDTGVTSLSAANNTGGLTATMSATATAAITGSAGNDVITTGVALTTGSVDAGAGTDTLVLGANVAHANTTTLAAKYTNFETIRVADDFDMSLFQSATGVEITASTDKSITGMTATQATNVKILGNISAGGNGGVEGLVLALAASSGTSDVVSITTGTGLTTAAATNIAGGLTVTGFETLNIATNAGPTATVGANKTTTIASLTGATLNKVNMTGTAVAITNGATTVATTFDASALTGDGTTTGSKGLTIGGSLVAGSTVTGSAYIDTVTVGAEGSAYNLGAGNDAVTASVAVLTADGTTDGTINGGEGTDTLTISDATTVTMTDNQFTKLSNMEKLTLSDATGAIAITTGTAFNAAFASGATITTDTLDDGVAGTFTFNGGLSTVNTTVTVNATDMVANGAGEDIVVTTGTGADTITVTGDATWVGGTAADGGSIVITSGAGVDTISVTIGDLVSQSTSQAISITAGTGADVITKVGTNGITNATATATFIMAEGDSTTTAWDKITGFDTANGSEFSDSLNFAGTGAVGTLSTSVDYNTILSHTISNGFASFDDASAYATALVINSSNLSDVIGYLTANTAADDVVAFLYDTDGNGANDATLVFHNGATSDSIVQLTGLTTATALTTTLTTATANYIAIA